MKPTDELRHEHEVILHVLKAAAEEVRAMEATGRARPDLISMMLDFFRNFADRCHHAKEEKHLFPALERRGMPHDSGPIAVMLQEHIDGRQRLGNIDGLLSAARTGDKDAARGIAENLKAYVMLLEDHIARENGVLFPMADQALASADQEELGKAFAQVEEVETGEGVHEKYHGLAHEISDLVMR